MNILKDTTDFGRRKLIVEGNADLHVGDEYEGNTVKDRTTIRECDRCGDGHVKTFLSLGKVE